MSEWLPIETAPKDGTKILVWATNYYGKSGKGIYVAEWDLGWDCPGCSGYERDRLWDIPTHWMPLPDPPKEAE